VADARANDNRPSKINPSNSHPSNPIHKAAQAAQKSQPVQTTPETEATSAAALVSGDNEPPQHKINKTAVIITVAIVAALLFMRRA